ncbi:MAG TPA: hypothetical protein VLN56_03475 [Gammaproteobacteria bacterium]|nr:hypothetical protein [Gammaproteobacteria bacterium]
MRTTASIQAESLGKDSQFRCRIFLSSGKSRNQLTVFPIRFKQETGTGDSLSSTLECDSHDDILLPSIILVFDYSIIMQPINRLK